MTPQECVYQPHGLAFTPLNVRKWSIMGQMFAGPLHIYQRLTCSMCGELLDAQCLLHPLVNGACGEVPEPPAEGEATVHA